ncbi:MAG: TetR/AcrR family transcriptional regulator [Actinomycetota bacterium]|nr:helix-turn-helix transcriptional regulator [Acidimicrobiia bacterium]MDQ3147275.1 TetR/AcrR family transcriptional regulator [Actinomycetota bacterium]
MDGRTGKGERTRARLLEVAVRRFAAEGYRRTSLSAVADDAGVTPAAAYAYFRGKEGLFEAAVDADAAALIDEALGGLGEGAMVSPHSLLLPLLVAGLETHPLARRVLAGQEPEVIDRLLALPSLLELRARVADGLALAQSMGAVRADIDPQSLSIGLETVVLALLIASLQVHGVDEERTAGVGAVFDAILKSPPAVPPRR